MPEHMLSINEIFYSIQGESTWSGLPCAFVRLKGCPLRCHYCDTSYAFTEGEKRTLSSIIEEVEKLNTRLVEITGGEPLIQPHVHELMAKFLDLGYEVLLETSGERDISICDSRVKRIIDIKTPASGAMDSFHEANYGYVNMNDEVKFVIMDKGDFDWAIDIVTNRDLLQKVNAVHFSPVMAQQENSSIEGSAELRPEELSAWLLDSGLPIRLQLQVHKYIWPPQTRGV